MSDSPEFWYRTVEAVGFYPEPRESNHMASIRVVNEEPLSEGFPSHVQRVAEMLETCGFSDDMGHGSYVTLTVTYRREERS